MRKMIALAALALALSGCKASAADKGEMTLDQFLNTPAKKLGGCFVESSVVGTFLRADREAQGGIGGGCDAVLANLILGAGIRADWADWRNAGSIFAKLGVKINNGVDVYGLAEWKIPEWKVRDAGQLAIGAGTEIKLDIINPALSMFGEGTVAATKFGTAATKDDVTARFGLRYRF